jgi:hypothetical protein
VLFDVSGWTFIVVAVINAVPKVRRLLADAAGRDRAGSRARSQDWAGLRQSVILAGTGLTLLQLPVLRTGRFRWPVDLFRRARRAVKVPGRNTLGAHPAATRWTWAQTAAAT